MPYTLGDGELAEDAIDLAIEVDDDLLSPVVRPARPPAEQIAETLAGLIEDSATLQLGIGQIPDATLRALAPRRRLAIWSEMISDGVLGLEQEGALDAARPIVCSFLFGSPELYQWADSNPRLRLLRTETTNDPGRIAARRSMISINAALQVDLFDQVNAAHVNDRVYSGFGGQPDFVAGALHSPGGRAVIALPSWHAASDRSTIVGRLETPVTSFQHSAVVTEQGCAQLFGRSERAQARLLIAHAAHPDARDQLREEAASLGLGADLAADH